jgi:hypothetical protein
MRNPSIEIKFKGKYSLDNDKVWDKELKEKLGYDQKNDGIMFITLREFIEYFDNYTICYYRDDFIPYTIPLPDIRPHKSKYFTFKINYES